MKIFLVNPNFDKNVSFICPLAISYKRKKSLFILITQAHKKAQEIAGRWSNAETMTVQYFAKASYGGPNGNRTRIAALRGQRPNR